MQISASPTSESASHHHRPMGSTRDSANSASGQFPASVLARALLARASSACVFTTKGERLMFENHQKSEIDALLKSSTEFRSLYQRHQELDSKLRDADLGVLPMDDTTLHSLKKEKLRAKDRLVHLWEHRSGAH
ncbi:YdcH family protein [Tahibacter sp.]|uniref:YdcH family protein n=1 Tax=Tahibacter sp. TaxID=2056211 RepID=UPI0039C9C94E